MTPLRFLLIASFCLLSLTGGANTALAKTNPLSSATAKAPAKAVPSALTKPKAKAEKKKVWVLEQETSQLGRMTIYAAQDAVLVKVGSTGGTMLAKAPDWKVSFFNTNDRVVYESTYEKFQRQELPSLISTADYFEKRKLAPQLCSYYGIRAFRAFAPTPEGTVGMMMPSYSGVGNAKASSKSQVVYVFCSEKNPVPAKVIAILKAIYRVPRFGGFPLGVQFQYSDGSTGITLKTYSMKEANLSASIFSYSFKGYTPAKTAETAILSRMLESTFAETP